VEIQTLDDLRAIGRQLDLDQFPRIYGGGLVLPDEPSIAPLTSGKEKLDGKTRSSQRTRKEQTSRSWSINRKAPFVGADFRAHYEKSLSTFLKEYPKTQHWVTNRGMWLITECSILRGMKYNATFLIFVPFVQPAILKGWAFWTDSISSVWIGPRHTNYPDGSICAFEPKDETWRLGDRLITLLDIYCLWAIRHLHLKEFNKWPGRQSVHFAYERLRELRDDECCGCAHGQKSYANCCKPQDLALDRSLIASEFLLSIENFGIRKPPEKVLNFLKERISPPQL
jgi:hypothetical protein